jgi:hypothetical protein
MTTKTARQSAEGKQRSLLLRGRLALKKRGRKSSANMLRLANDCLAPLRAAQENLEALPQTNKAGLRGAAVVGGTASPNQAMSNHQCAHQAQRGSCTTLHIRRSPTPFTCRKKSPATVGPERQMRRNNQFVNHVDLRTLVEEAEVLRPEATIQDLPRSRLRVGVTGISRPSASYSCYCQPHCWL